MSFCAPCIRLCEVSFSSEITPTIGGRDHNVYILAAEGRTSSLGTQRSRAFIEAVVASKLTFSVLEVILLASLGHISALHQGHQHSVE